MPEPDSDPRPHLCVFCGSSSGGRASYTEAARRLGQAVARSGLGLVYGGGCVGLMGVVADAALEAGGRVVGVIPDPLVAREVAHLGLSELIVVPGMHERKALMASRSDGFVTLPGGVGTFEEFFEILSWANLGLHHKPMGILDVEGYFDALLGLLDRGVAEGFVRRDQLAPLVVSEDPEALVAGMLGHIQGAARRFGENSA